MAWRLLHRATPPFQNRHPHGRPTLTDLLRWHRERRRRGLPMPPNQELSPAKPNLSLIHGDHCDGNVTWIGHSTLLVQMGKRNILTDPHFSLHASPIPGLGPKRWQAPGITAHDLPDIDVVLISHNHYDHLDRASVQILAERNNKLLFLVPLGLDHWFASNVPRAKIRTMGWDESVQMDELEIVFVAVQHWSGRNLADTNRSLWGGIRAPDTANPIFLRR